MLRQDYITRMVQEMVRMLLKLMFGIEAESPDLEMFRDAQARERTERLLMLADEGRIDEAENELSDILESCVPEHMQTGLLFYWHLNEKDDAFLETHDFSREEIRDGLEQVVKDSGMADLADAFLEIREELH